MKMGALSSSRLSFGAKNSSLARITLPPRREAAKSTSSVNSFTFNSLFSILPSKQTAARLSELAAFVDAFAAQKGRVYFPAQNHTVVGRDLLFVLQLCRLHHDSGIGFEDNQIGVAADLDRTLVVQSCQRRRSRAHPARHVRQC